MWPCGKEWDLRGVLVLLVAAQTGHPLGLRGLVRAFTTAGQECGWACCLHSHHTSLLEARVTCSGFWSSFFS